MKVTIIHGQVIRLYISYFQNSGRQDWRGSQGVFSAKRFGEFCIGCTQCFRKSETLCPHYEKINPLTEALDEADVLIFESPVYVYHVTGSMKAFLDHYGYRWMFIDQKNQCFTNRRYVYQQLLVQNEEYK